MRGISLILGMCLLASPAIAQDSRVTISAGAAAQPTTASFTDVTSFPYFAETARTEGRYHVGDGVAFDVAGTVRVWKAIGVGVGVTRVTRTTDAETSGSFPHPFYFRTNRTGSWSASSLDRTETGVHLSVAWQALRAERVNATIFAGPSAFSFKQAVVDSIDVIQSYPYDTIDARLVTGSIDGTVVGFHAGADVGWFFSRHVGVGALLRYTAAKKKGVRIGDGEPFDLEVGGFQGGGGVRLRF